MSHSCVNELIPIKGGASDFQRYCRIVSDKRDHVGIEQCCCDCRVEVRIMNRALSKKSIALLLAAALLIAIQLNSTSRTVRSSLIERDAVISGDNAAIHVMPSRHSSTISICFRGQRLIIREPSIFEFYRARCNKVDGWIARDHITLKD